MRRASAFLLLAALLPACQSVPGRPPVTPATLTPAPLEGGKLRVTATTNLVADLARVVGGERVEVSALMGPGVDPHLYKASARDVRTLAGAGLILYGGLHLEGKMVELLEKNRRAVAVTQGLPANELLKLPGSDWPDPHVWFDVTLWKRAAETTRDALSAADPAGRSVYARNAAAYLRELGALDAEVLALMRSVPERQRVLVTAHDAFHYFARRYGVEVRGVQGVSTAAEAGTRNIQELARFVAERGIPAVFVESSVPQRTVDAVIAAARARGHGLRVGGELFSDALGSPGTPEGTYVGMLRHNARVIAQALGGQAPDKQALGVTP